MDAVSPTYLSHNGVDRSVQSKSLADNVIQDRQLLQLLIGQVAESTVGVSELLLLLSIQFLPTNIYQLIIPTYAARSLTIRRPVQRGATMSMNS